MKKILIPFMLASCALVLLPTNNNNDSVVINNNIKKYQYQEVTEKVTINVMNMEDYIYVNDPTDPDSLPDLTEQFEKYAEDNLGYVGGVEVVYNTTDTNETLLTQLTTGKTGYDLICPSDYMIQKMIAQDLIEPLAPEPGILDNYDTYASKYIRNCLDSIDAVTGNGAPTTVGEYAVGYMWGTLGILFNPFYQSYDTFSILKKASDWHLFWDQEFYGTASIKDSMRDTYAMALMEVFHDEFQDAQDKLNDGTYSEEEYKAVISEIFNRCDQETVDKVGDALSLLRNNIYGLEVDSGKQDIVQQRIGINLAWSGDAVYSLELGDEEDVTLCYSIPQLGSNIWFDAWVMPKSNSRTPLQRRLALQFLDFLCMPEIASLNMDETGYTSFIGGDAILELDRSWYDIRYSEVNYIDEGENEYPVVVKEDDKYRLLTYEDCFMDSHNDELDDTELYYDEAYEEPEEGEEYIPDEDSLIPVPLLDDGEETEEVKTYGDLLIVDEEESDLQEVDLNYFFNNDFGTEDYVPNKDYYFYTGEYYYSYEEEIDGELVSFPGEDDYLTVGRGFYCQYPDYETILRCAVMKDYGPNNDIVLKMWEKFRSNSLPLWATILLCVEVALLVGAGVYFFVNKKIKYKLRKSRKEERLKQTCLYLMKNV